MACRVFLLLLVSGLCTLSSCFPHQYHFVNMSKSWTEAQSYCRETYTDLVAIDNPEEMNRVINSVNLTGYTGAVWIGLEKGNSWKWQWSLDERRLYSDGQTGFSNWDNGEPNNSGGKENCVGMRDNKTWNDIPCDYKSSTGFFVCYDGTEQTSQRYVFINQNNTNWTEAQRYCRETYADLVAIDNPEEMNRVINSVNLTGYTGAVWIGLEKGNSWKWQWSLEERHLYSDGQTGFSNWDSGKPDNSGGNENCVAMRDKGKWNDQSCDSKSSTGFFVCYDGTEQTNQRYVFINQNNTNWTEAQRYCRENHTDLVSVRNQTENDLIQKMFTTGTWVWIGLYRDYWQWSDQRNSSFRYWAPGKPDNYDGNENCTVAWFTHTDSGTWDDGQCGENHPFLCYDDHLILIQKNMTWNEALNYCRENYTDLVSVHDEQIQHWVEKKAKNATSAHVWLGLRFSCTLSFWFWASAEPVCYDNWSSDNGTGTGHCGNTGAIKSGGHQWVSLPETTKLNFICVTYPDT